MLVVVSNLSDVFSIKNYWSVSIDQQVLTSETVKFMVNPGYAALQDKHFPSLIALIALEEAKLVFIDGYHQNIFYRCSQMIHSLMSYMLPSELTKTLVRNRITYNRVATKNDETNTKIRILKEAVDAGEDTVDLSVVPWEVYSKEILPSLYDPYTDDETSTLN